MTQTQGKPTQESVQGKWTCTVPLETLNLLNFDKLIEYARIHGECCDFYKDLTNVHVIRKDESTASASSIILADLMSQQVVIKAFVDPVGGNGLFYEAFVYQKCVRSLLDNHFTPNLVEPIAYVRCKDILLKWLLSMRDENHDNFIDSVVNSFRELRIYPTTEQLDAMTINLIITKRKANINLEEWLHEDRPWSVILCIVFQVLFTLECFNLVGLRHNDLHLGNILVQDLMEGNESGPIPLTKYEFDGKIYYVPSRYRVLIYDFDRSSLTRGGAPKNNFLEQSLCKRVGECNGPSIFYDLFKFLTIMQDILDDHVVKTDKGYRRIRDPRQKDPHIYLVDEFETKFNNLAISKKVADKEVVFEYEGHKRRTHNLP